jgi:SAM-dependent methyltransferase
MTARETNGPRTTNAANGSCSGEPFEHQREFDYHQGDTAELYQRIYDQHPWYGDANQGRCPGVRLLAQYAHWLIEPVLDLGCGRGQTVEHLRELGFKAEGIDQIRIHPGMRVGDITKPIADIEQFNSVVCVDCLEHLFPIQVEGLFANMKHVQRQAFSIHNGESTGTGQELHVNRLEFSQWESLIEKHFKIEAIIPITAEQKLYLTQTKEPIHEGYLLE